LEDLDDNENLSKIAEIIRCIMLLNDMTVLDLLVSDGMFLSVAGVMEFDPLLKTKPEFRSYLSGTVKRKDVTGAELKDSNQIAAVEKVFKLRFLRDSLARPALEESGTAAIDNSVAVATYEMCVRIMLDYNLIQTLLSVISPAIEVASMSDATNSASVIENGCSTSEVSAHSRLDALTFLRDLFHHSRFLAFDRRSEIYNRFLLGAANGFEQNGGLRKVFFGVCLDILADSSSTPLECSLIAECLVCLTAVCPNHLRKTIMQGPTPTFPPSLTLVRQSVSRDLAPSTVQPLKQNNKCILWVFIRRLVMDSDHALLDNLGEIIRVLIDPDRFEKQEKDSFLGVFYDHYIHWFLVPFAEQYEPDKELPREILDLSIDVEAGVSSAQEVQGQSAVMRSRRVLVDLMCLCVGGHSYRMKYFVVRNGAIGLILRLMKSNRRQLQLSAIKFMRTIVASKDEFYLRNVVKQDLLSPILNVLKLGKDGLITSAVLEMVDFICTQQIYILVNCIFEKHGESFANQICAEIHEKIKRANDQAIKSATDGTGLNNMGSIENPASLASSALRQKRQQERDCEDEYFFDDDVFSFPSSNSANPIDPLNYIASAYSVDESDGDAEVKGVIEPASTGNSHSDAGLVVESVAPLPPLKPKFEVDESPEILLRARSKESDLNRLSQTEVVDSSIVMVGTVSDSSSSSSELSVSGGVSFSMKKRRTT